MGSLAFGKVRLGELGRAVGPSACLGFPQPPVPRGAPAPTPCCRPCVFIQWQRFCLPHMCPGCPVCWVLGRPGLGLHHGLSQRAQPCSRLAVHRGPGTLLVLGSQKGRPRLQTTKGSSALGRAVPQTGFSYLVKLESFSCRALKQGLCPGSLYQQESISLYVVGGHSGGQGMR